MTLCFLWFQNGEKIIIVRGYFSFCQLLSFKVESCDTLNAQDKLNKIIEINRGGRR